MKSQGQDETYFYLLSSGEPQKIKFHDYNEIYKTPGLYEQIFYDRLKCISPIKVATILDAAIKQNSENFSELRVLDLGAGNGMAGEELKNRGASRIVGIDIVPGAYDALIRDRPGVYDAYHIQDFTALDQNIRDEIISWDCNCMVTVAALGFGDIPVKAFIEAFNIISEKGWVAFNIKETFLDKTDTSGFSRMMRELIFSNYFDIHHLERYRHRLSIDGKPLFYFAIAGKKNSSVTDEFLQSIDISFS